ncbi:Transcriptional coactivator [Trema orientale]|uniref:Transcriptional coactivator n=1 Tax=Trema orientale TaxID=63057 RepID=A0A2P5EYF8_TREOI|nr:Transcriptional coactivator [Trema orientale]
MSLNQGYSRIDTVELKAVIVQKIGLQRAEKYFDQLRRLFSFKISKCEFNKFCIRTIGRENISLHNQLIRSIVKNACLSKVPPTRGIREVKITNGGQRNNLQSLYGDAFTPSPRKGRSQVNRDRKFRDRPSPLGPFGKPQSVTYEELISKAQEQQSATELLSLGSRPPVEVASVEDGEEVEQDAGSPGVQSRSPVTAPLGISMNLGGARKALSNKSIGNNYCPETCQNSGELPDTRSLRNRVKQKLEMEGLGISVDCVNLLNNGLDAYLKRLIEPCMRLAGSRHGNEHLKQLNGRFIRGLNGAVVPGRHAQCQLTSTCASLLDFRAAMEFNPHALGEDWAIQLEKIGLRASEE